MILSHGEETTFIPRGTPSGKERSTANEGSTTVTLPISGELTEKQAFDWMNAQIPYENLATNDDIAHRALAFTQQAERKFKQDIQPIWSNWKVVNYALRGNTFARCASGRDPVHIPEMYKCIETLCPRLEEAVFHYHDWFVVRGRESSDKKQERAIQEFLRYQLDVAGFSDMVQPAFRLMLTHGVAPFKVYWDIETDEKVDRDITKKEKGDEARFRILRKSKREVRFQGNRIRLMDPIDLMVDLDATNLRDARYVGDRCRMTLDQIANGYDMGIYANTWERLIRQPGREDPERLMNQQSRGPEQQSVTTPYIEGGVQEHEVVEWWCRFDAFGTGRTREFVITVADGNVVLRVQENPHDDKHRPYAVARASREPFRFFNTSPSDLAVGAQFSIDENWNLMMDAQRYAVSPIVAVHDDGDCPDSFWGQEPGKVIRTRTPPTWIKSPSVISDFVGYHNLERQNIEEIYGAPRIMQGTEGGNTATEIERKLQEGNKRSIGYVRSMTGAVEQILKIMHANNQQYIGKEETFRVLGKAGARLETYNKVDPVILDVDVDFEFMGPSNLQTVGLRATQLQAFLSVTYPMLQTLPPNSVDFLALIEELFDLLVGSRLGSDIIKVPQRLDEMMPAEDENVLLAQGQEVGVHENDDDRQHLITHAKPMVDPDFKRKPLKVQQAHHDHVAWHKAQAKKKKAMEEAKSRMTPAFSGPEQPTEVDKDRGTTGERGPGMNGISAQPGQTPQGETPGPPTLFGGRSPDRKGGMNQTNNRPQ